MTGDQAIVVEQPFDRDSLYVLRATLEAHATEAGLPRARTLDLVLAVHELATNVMLHGSGTGRVHVRVVDGMLQCQVIDDGATSPEAGEPVWPYEHGHGLWIVRALGDRHAVTRGPDGTVASVAFALPRPHRTDFRLTRIDRDGTTTLRLAGELDEHAAPEVAAAVHDLLEAVPPRRLVLDLAGMTLCDPVGIAAILRARQHVDATPGASLTLTGLSGDLRARLDTLSSLPLTYDAP
ncbi:MAG TPA: ATP-binding protein [Nonomuraea sp.]|nr:ATP-binding protein [Nonomuraea sp.]